MGPDRRSDARAPGRGGARQSESRLKRPIDILGALVGLVLAGPLLLACAVAVRLTSSGPILFRQVRLGEGGFPFICFKFRTMVTDAEEWMNGDDDLRKRYRENGFKIPRDEDPRITSVGHFLRFWHLDELPQLWNVLRGEISLVGPRPIVEEEICHYGERAELFLSMRPGIFGPWTALGRRRPNYPDRTDVELSYLEKRSLAYDFRLLMSCLPVLARGQDEDS